MGPDLSDTRLLLITGRADGLQDAADPGTARWASDRRGAQHDWPPDPVWTLLGLCGGRALPAFRTLLLDRKSVVSGKSVSVRVDLGGRRIIKKKIKTNLTIANVRSSTHISYNKHNHELTMIIH